ncbi:MAG: S1C family serine protease [Candidatus Methylomirabilales bacterium]
MNHRCLQTAERDMDAPPEMVSGVLPAVVSIQATIRPRHPSTMVLGEERMGTGVIVDTGGYLLTVNYVVLGAEYLGVSLADGRRFQARLVAQDFDSGLAVLRIPPQDLPAVRLGSSMDLLPGQPVFLLAATGTVERRLAEGFITYLGEFDTHWEYMLDKIIGVTIQNPGFGGAPLFDSVGRVVGIASLNLSEVARATVAIPVELYQLNRTELLEFGRVASRAEKAWVGAYFQPVEQGVLVAGLVPGGPAEAAGIREGDVILAVDYCTVETRRDLYEELWKKRAKEKVVFKILREEQVTAVEVVSGSREEFYQ